MGCEKNDLSAQKYKLDILYHIYTIMSIERIDF